MTTIGRTAISVCARAVMNLGGKPFNSFDAKNDIATFLKVAYPEIRATIIGSYAWECMKKRQELTQEDVDPGGFRYAYVIPFEAQSAPIAAYISDDPWGRATSGFEVRSGRIVTNYERLWLEYAVIRPEAEWPPWFANLVMSAVTAEIAMMVTDQQNVKDHWETKTYGTPSENRVGGLMGECMSIDAQGSGNNPGLSDTAFVDARFGGVYPGDHG